MTGVHRVNGRGSANRSRRLGLAAVGVLAASLLAAIAPTPASAAESDEPLLIDVTGHGWGHARGLGQWGAQGYAIDHGWSSDQILDHFYGGTTAGQAPENGSVNPNAVRVEIRSQRDTALRVDLGWGTIKLRSTGGDDLGEVVNRAVQMAAVEGGGTRIEHAETCDGPWEELVVTQEAVVDLIPEPRGTGANGLLKICHDNGTNTWYPGYLRFHGDRGRTVNVTTIENYLRGVVPSEVPASWDMEALEAQAVAARSYALAGDTRQQPYADTCDTILCQVYLGFYRETSQGFEATRETRTDTAIANTAGIVRLRGGSAARTEFSSSTGGYTLEGSFPAVKDDGDDTANNPHHNWTATADLRPLVNEHDKGVLTEINVARTGLGADGGHATSVTFVYTGGNVTETATTVRRALSLKSNWFSFGEVPLPSDAIATYVGASYSLFLGREASDDELKTWTTRLASGGSRADLTSGLANSDEWAGVMIEDLYQTVLGRGSDREGRAFWLDRMADGMRFEEVAVNFYGAPEYFDRVGGTNDAFVRSLYEGILGRSSDAEGLTYWTGRLDEASATPGGVATGFYQSIESRTDRVTSLYQRILGRDPEPGGLAYWADRLRTEDDVRLAALLASSDEFFLRSQSN